MERVFKRKLYDRLLEWKRIQNGKTAILIEGARRVGKSTLVEQFAKNEYESYILIDFNEQSKSKEGATILPRLLFGFSISHHKC